MVHKKLDPLKEAANFWAFQPLKKFDPPPVKNEAWTATPVDRFILAAKRLANLCQLVLGLNEFMYVD